MITRASGRFSWNTIHEITFEITDTRLGSIRLAGQSALSQSQVSITNTALRFPNSRPVRQRGCCLVVTCLQSWRPILVRGRYRSNHHFWSQRFQISFVCSLAAVGTIRLTNLSRHRRGNLVRVRRLGSQSHVRAFPGIGDWSMLSDNQLEEQLLGKY